MIDPFEVSILDRNSSALGVDTSTLMDTAGRAIAEEVGRMIGPGGSVLVVCGPGNNGGDGYVAAKYLKDSGYEVAVLAAKEPSTELSRFARMWSRTSPLKAEEMGPRDIDELMGAADLIVDGLLGAGSSGEPRGICKDLIVRINASGRRVVSVDIPSGIMTPLCVRAEATVTFHDIKTVMYSGDGPLPECGRVIVRDIGIPADAARVVGPGDMLRYPIPSRDSRKGDMGKVLVIGGGPYTGAPSLAAMAAVRAGADLVYALVPHGIAGAVSSFGPDLIVEGMAGPSHHLDSVSIPAIKKRIALSDIVLIGPGAGRQDPTIEVLLRAMELSLEAGKRIVVDADGLFALATAQDRLPGGDVLLTPHRGEMERLLLSHGLPVVPGMTDEGGIAEPYVEAMGSYSMDRDLTVLVKGPQDLIVGKGPHGLGKHIQKDMPGGSVLIRTNRSGHPAMSKGGTGDVLAGLCAGMMARGMKTFDAACLAAYINGKAGEVAFERRGYSLCASDLLDVISIVV